MLAGRVPVKRQSANSRTLSLVILLHVDSRPNGDLDSIFLEISKYSKSVRNENDSGTDPESRLKSSRSPLRRLRSRPNVDGRVDESSFKPKSKDVNLVSVVIGSMGPVSRFIPKLTNSRSDRIESSGGKVPASRLLAVLFGRCLAGSCCLSQDSN